MAERRRAMLTRRTDQCASDSRWETTIEEGGGNVELGRHPASPLAVHGQVRLERSSATPSNEIDRIRVVHTAGDQGPILVSQPDFDLAS
jgi:hypothetical protein